MRNPFSSLPSLPATLSLSNLSSIPLFARTNTDLESNVRSSKPPKRKSRSATRSSSHQHSSNRTRSSYASAFRTPLPVLSRTETITLDNVNVNVRQGSGAGLLYVETSLPLPPSLRTVARFPSEANVLDLSAHFEKFVQGDRGGGLGGDGEDATQDQEREAKMRALLEKYDPGDGPSCPAWPMEDYREMVEQMLLDGILVAAGKLRRHGWIMGSKNEHFRSLCTHERWDTIHEDLMRYTKAVEGYESWRKSPIRSLEFSSSSLPLQYDTYGRTLAVIECASKSEDPEEVALMKDLSRSLVHSHANWWRSHTFASHFRDRAMTQSARERVSTQKSRLALATFGGMALILPMLIMVLEHSLTSRLVTTTIFTFAVGWILAYWMIDATNAGIIALTAGYAAVLVLFVGSDATF